MELNIFDYGDSLLFEVKTYPIKPFEERSDEPKAVDNVTLEIYKNGEIAFTSEFEEYTQEGDVVDGMYHLTVNTYDDLDDYGDFKIQIIAVDGTSKQVLTDYLKLKKTYKEE